MRVLALGHMSLEAELERDRGLAVLLDTPEGADALVTTLRHLADGVKETDRVERKAAMAEFADMPDELRQFVFAGRAYAQVLRTGSGHRWVRSPFDLGRGQEAARRHTFAPPRGAHSPGEDSDLQVLKRPA